MKMFINRLKWVLLAVSLAGPWLLVGHSQAAFDKNLLITDDIFSRKTTMTAAQIDSFLNGFSSSCISTHNGFSAINPTGYSPSTGFTYSSGYVSAGTVISSAANAYDLNPQVLLTTLQKEQSLVTGGSGCDVLQYTGAVGYGCPDGGTTHNYSGLKLYRKNGVVVSSVNGTCVGKAAWAGFAQQVIRGAWLLKFGQQRSKGNVNWAIVRGSWQNTDDPATCYKGPMTQGKRARIAQKYSSSSCPYKLINYDGYQTIDGDSVFMGSGGTATLYWYTPHKSGNQHFVSIFEGWFGSTQGLADVAHPDGTVIRAVNNPAVYLVKDGARWNFPNQASFLSFGYTWDDVKPATDPDLALSLSGAMGYREGTLLKGSASTIFVVDYQSGTAVKRPFGSWTVFQGFGYSLDEVRTVSDASLPATTGSAFTTNSVPHPDGTLVRATNSPAVLLVQDGTSRGFPSPAVLFSHGYTWDDVKTANSSDSGLTAGAVMGFHEGTILKADAPTIYAVDDQGGTLVKRAFANWTTFSGLRYTRDDIVSVKTSDLPAGNGSSVGP